MQYGWLLRRFDYAGIILNHFSNVLLTYGSPLSKKHHTRVEWTTLTCKTSVIRSHPPSLSTSCCLRISHRSCCIFPSWKCHQFSPMAWEVWIILPWCSQLVPNQKTKQMLRFDCDWSSGFNGKVFVLFWGVKPFAIAPLTDEVSVFCVSNTHQTQTNCVCVFFVKISWASQSLHLLIASPLLVDNVFLRDEKRRGLSPAGWIQIAWIGSYKYPPASRELTDSTWGKVKSVPCKGDILIPRRVPYSS